MAFQLRPAVRENTPLIIGLAGPSKSGKTYSAHRLAQGIAPGGRIAMLNAEGARGHQYADRFKYLACDIEPPYSYARYTEAIQAIAKEGVDVLIIDSISHAHDGPGGMLEAHDRELDRLAGKDDYKRRERMTWTAWIRPKAAENSFIYAMLGLRCPVILCFRAKEKMEIRKGEEPKNLGYQPIASDRISFETIFTLLLPPHSKGVPDMKLSDMREPFDAMVPEGKPVDEALGVALREWATGGRPKAERPVAPPSGEPAAANSQFISPDQVIELSDLCKEAKIDVAALCAAARIKSLSELTTGRYANAKAWIEDRRQ